MAAKGVLLAIGLASVAGVLFSTLAARPVDAQEAAACRVIRSDGGTRYLERCGNRFRYVGLSFDDIRGRLEPFGRHSQFRFRCPLKPMCAGQPDILGWFIDRAWWARSDRGEDAVFAATGRMPVDALSWGTPGPAASAPKSQCGTFDVQVGSVPARGVCLLFTTGSRIIVAGGNDDLAFVLIFSQEGVDDRALLLNVREMLPRFQVEKLLDEAVLRKPFE
jgi:hypothetical protein